MSEEKQSGDKPAEDKKEAAAVTTEAPKEAAQDAPKEALREPKAPGTGLQQRRSRWYSSLAALRYVSSLSKDDEIKVRDSDRATSIFLLISSVLTILSLVFRPLAAHRLPLVLVCDALVGVMLVFYVANRFGILNTLTPRQALLTWQLMMGASFLGIFATINLAVLIAMVVANNSIEIPR